MGLGADLADQRPVSEEFQRARGVIRLGVQARAGVPGVTDYYQEGSAKMRLPRRGDGVIEAMILNTSGGLAGDDRFAMDVLVADGTLVTSTQASERVYKCAGSGAAEVTQTFRVGAGGRLVHQPQPTILFDDASLRRRTRLEVSGEGASAIYCEGFVLGRAAMGETVRTISLSDRTEVVWDDRLCVLDAVRLDAGMLARARRRASLGGARGFGIVIHVAADARTKVPLVRTELADLGSASVVGGCLVARLLAPSHTALQDALNRVARRLTGLDAPRSHGL